MRDDDGVCILRCVELEFVSEPLSDEAAPQPPSLDSIFSLLQQGLVTEVETVFARFMKTAFTTYLSSMSAEVRRVLSSEYDGGGVIELTHMSVTAPVSELFTTNPLERLRDRFFYTVLNEVGKSITLVDSLGCTVRLIDVDRYSFSLKQRVVIE